MVRNELLEIARTIADVRRLVRGWRAQGLSIGLVPTMGWLHDGHLALIERARSENDRVIATLFVNPLQFGPTEDFAAYPRDDGRDFAILRERRCDAVFAPAPHEMFPQGTASIDEAQSRVSVAPLATVLCGVTRPGHFDGVATIVLKLFMITLPDVAYFGEKDYQQLTIIKRFVADLDVPIRISGVPIVREPDGLALSSRNVYLSAAQRSVAPAMQRMLLWAQETISSGVDVGTVLAAGRERLLSAGFDAVEYVTFASGDRLESLSARQAGARLFAAAWLGRTRLIDNIAADATPLG